MFDCKMENLPLHRIFLPFQSIFSMLKKYFKYGNFSRGSRRKRYIKISESEMIMSLGIALDISVDFPFLSCTLNSTEMRRLTFIWNETSGMKKP